MHLFWLQASSMLLKFIKSLINIIIYRLKLQRHTYQNSSQNGQEKAHAKLPIPEKLYDMTAAITSVLVAPIDGL